MLVGDLTILWRGESVEVSREGAIVATGRWRDGVLGERSGSLDETGDDSALWQAIESAIRQDEDAIIASATAKAFDARGVDVTQIDWMLSLTPLERLAALETHTRSIVRLLGDASVD